MAKRIRFPLEMDNDVEVRDLESLKIHFSISRVINYLKDGRLITWLRDRYCDDIADKLASIDLGSKSMTQEVCTLFGVEYNQTIQDELEKSDKRAARINKLREFTKDREFIKHIDNVAFDQTELDDLLDKGLTEIFLCGEHFSIPMSREGITYTGINRPVVVIDSDHEVDWEEKSVKLRDVVFDEKYQAILEKKKMKYYVKFANGNVLDIPEKGIVIGAEDVGHSLPKNASWTAASIFWVAAAAGLGGRYQLIPKDGAKIEVWIERSYGYGEREGCYTYVNGETFQMLGMKATFYTEGASDDDNGKSVSLDIDQTEYERAEVNDESRTSRSIWGNKVQNKK